MNTWKRFVKEEKGQVELPFNLVVALVVAVIGLGLIYGIYQMVKPPVQLDLRLDNTRIDGNPTSISISGSVVKAGTGVGVPDVTIDVSGCGADTAGFTDQDGNIESFNADVRIPAGEGKCIVKVTAQKTGGILSQYLEDTKNVILLR